jgi:2-succinyl-5-enolpyruvyl-6-hydroxy-3-cyclohexene-1-carboxylate synthase
MNPATALAQVLVDELVRGGVQDAVLAPGSRSAPLALALHDADAGGRLRLHVRIDERSAGFLALGLAKVSGHPVPVVTTSGTAAANLYPAVVEASQAGVPLLALTADRPAELRGTGANQTVDQVKAYGSSVRLFHEVGVPEERAGQNAYWRALTCRALALAAGATTGDPGPVHLNLALREPLVPDAEPAWPEPLDGRPDGGPWTVVTSRAAGPAAGDLPSAGDWPERTLVVVGDASPELGRAARSLAEACRWPLVSEPSGNAREGAAALRCGHLLLENGAFVSANLPERLLLVGRTTLHRGVLALAQRVSAGVDVVAPTARWADPTRTARRVLPWLPTAPLSPGAARGWLDAWLAADAAASRALDALLDADPAAEPTVARDLHAALRDGTLLVAGSSMPVRDLCASRPRPGVTVVANRGAAGIDGTVSTAWGAAWAWQRREPPVGTAPAPAVALVGDLTFLHDAVGLACGPDEPRPDLTFVVVDNDGGGIFGLLEPGADPDRKRFERVFGTSHGVDLAALCGATATPHVRVSTAGEVVAAVLDPRPGMQVVEIRTDRASARALADATRAAVADAVGPGPTG